MPTYSTDDGIAIAREWAQRRDAASQAEAGLQAHLRGQATAVWSGYTAAAEFAEGPMGEKGRELYAAWVKSDRQLAESRARFDEWVRLAYLEGTNIPDLASLLEVEPRLLARIVGVPVPAGPATTQ